MDISEIQKKVSRIAEEHGWHKLPTERVMFRLTKLALIGSEVGEAVEAVRNNDRAQLGEELADIVMRVADLADIAGLNLGAEIKRKMEINKSRPYEHGGKGA